MMTSKWTTSISLSMLLLSVFLSISSSSLISVWLFMEMNLLCFVVFCWSSINSKWEMVPKYFTIQALGSSILFLSILTTLTLGAKFFDLVLFLSLMLKLGGFPFFHWFVNMSKMMKGEVLFYFLTVQKVIPLYMLCLLNNTQVTMLLANGVVGVFLAINSQNINILLSCSSVFSLSWLLGSVPNFLLILVFMVLYMIILWPMIEISFSESLFTSANYSLLEMKNALLFSMSALVLFGFPPSAGFYIKLALINFMSLYLSPVIVSMLLILSFGFVYAYSKLMLQGFSMKKEDVLRTKNYSLLSYIMIVVLWLGPLLLM